MTEFEKIMDGMEPEEAIIEIAAALKKLFPLIEQKSRIDFVAHLLEESAHDKISSMVYR